MVKSRQRRILSVSTVMSKNFFSSYSLTHLFLTVMKHVRDDVREIDFGRVASFPPSPHQRHRDDRLKQSRGEADKAEQRGQRQRVHDQRTTVNVVLIVTAMPVSMMVAVAAMMVMVVVVVIVVVVDAQL